MKKIIVFGIVLLMVCSFVSAQGLTTEPPADTGDDTGTGSEDEAMPLSPPIPGEDEIEICYQDECFTGVDFEWGTHSTSKNDWDEGNPLIVETYQVNVDIAPVSFQQIAFIQDPSGNFQVVTIEPQTVSPKKGPVQLDLSFTNQILPNLIPGEPTDIWTVLPELPNNKNMGHLGIIVIPEEPTPTAAPTPPPTRIGGNGGVRYYGEIPNVGSEEGILSVVDRIGKLNVYSQDQPAPPGLTNTIPSNEWINILVEAEIKDKDPFAGLERFLMSNRLRKFVPRSPEVTPEDQEEQKPEEEEEEEEEIKGTCQCSFHLGPNAWYCYLVRGLEYTATPGQYVETVDQGTAEIGPENLFPPHGASCTPGDLTCSAACGVSADEQAELYWDYLWDRCEGHELPGSGYSHHLVPASPPIPTVEAKCVVEKTDSLATD